MDEKKIKEICGDVGRMDFEDASEAAKQLEDGDFLPQLKFDALKELEQRMSRLNGGVRAFSQQIAECI